MGSRCPVNKLMLKKNVIISIAVLLLAFMLIPMSILGWFAAGNKNTTDDFDVGVVGGAVKGTLDIILNGNIPSGSMSTGALLPGEYLYANIILENTTSSDKMYQIQIDKTAVLYPTADTDFIYEQSYINCHDYYVNNVLLESDNIINEATFRKFVTPVTDALQCGVYYAQGVGFDSNYIPQYFTQAGNASSIDLLSENFVNYTPYLSYIPISAERSLDGQIDLGDEGIIIEQDALWIDGKIILGESKRLTLYLVIYFSPNAYTSAEISINEELKTVQLRNSNAYVQQRFSITLAIDNQ